MTGQAVETIEATRQHPFYVEGKGFVAAAALGIGNAIVTRAGPSLVVGKVEWKRRAEGYDVYNLIVEGDHTYFVGNSNGGLWVHNGPGDCIKNGHLAGDAHPNTGIPFNDAGYPTFDSTHDVKLPANKIGPTISDEEQMRYATQDLKSAIGNDSQLRGRFTPGQIEDINAGGPRVRDYTWHHHEDGETLQLVERRIHRSTGHSGGRQVTGGRP